MELFKYIAFVQVHGDSEEDNFGNLEGDASLNFAFGEFAEQSIHNNALIVVRKKKRELGFAFLSTRLPKSPWKQINLFVARIGGSTDSILWLSALSHSCHENHTSHITSCCSIGIGVCVPYRRDRFQQLYWLLLELLFFFLLLFTLFLFAISSSRFIRQY